ncbi:MAG: DegV family protein [bacterium]|nr:DegV family protein [bacterium]
MEKIKIATDSTADIPKLFCEKLNISVLPLTIIAGEKEYRDGVDITPAEFYKIIDASKQLPVSSQVASVLYSDLFEETWKAGYTDLIQVTLNSKGSGTYQAAVLSRKLFYEEHPEAKEQLAIHMIDSKTYSMAYGIGVIEGAQLVQNGASAQEVIAHIEDWLTHTRPVFVPLNLRCVKKSGRISPAAAFVGDAIGLKPLITFEEGEAKIIGKARGEQKAIAALLERCMKERRPDTNYAIVYGCNTEALAHLKEACAQLMDRPPIAEYQVGCVISINTGPNMIGMLYRT